MSFTFQVPCPRSKVQGPIADCGLRNTQHATCIAVQAPSPKGFTLLEVLVASSILSIVLAILYGVFSQTLKSRQIAEERAALSRTARVVLLRIGEDLQASFPFAAGNARFTGETRRTSSFPQASMSFMSFASGQLTAGGREGDWSEIAYDLIPDPLTPTLWQLIRRVRLSAETTRVASEGEMLPLLSRVQGLRLRFFDGRGWAEEWGRDQTRGRIPHAVEVELMLAVSDSRKRQRTLPSDAVRFSTVVDLPLARAGGAVSRPGGGL
ncbi:MAG: prepilin-type N-terminal cleavage/methylation domain-containing protein [Deltaproteobacteria bacterium]|nr:prepilin-type N-terminal cleavage/methylation domain-containing protein [Deltaproteobacteria bacterium]